MTGKVLAARSFSRADQDLFGSLSGDVNPMHMDALAARRTQAGEPVVHGMHALLWALDCLCESEPQTSLDTVSVKFDRFVALDVPVSLWLSEGRYRKLVLRHNNTRLMTVTLNRALPDEDDGDDPALPWGQPSAYPTSPAQPSPVDVVGDCGVFHLHSLASRFEHLAAKTGADAIDAMAGLSTLVGMVVPGLHSIYFAVDLRFENTAAPSGLLGYRVKRVHEALLLVETRIVSAQLAGTVRAFFRPPPVQQATMNEISHLVDNEEFRSVKALIIGGSRGIGEVTAKIIAAGGGESIITYAAGSDDAERVVEEIQAYGMTSSAIHVDALRDLKPQLVEMGTFDPTHIFYYASPRIFLQGEQAFDANAYARFGRIYVTAFGELCEYALSLDHDVHLFFPSTSALDSRPRGMTEYTMAKAAGEILCSDLDRFNPKLHITVTRLPRLLTDQTATVSIVDSEPILPVILRVLRSIGP